MRKTIAFFIVLVGIAGFVYQANARQISCYAAAMDAMADAETEFRDCTGDCGSNVYCSDFCRSYYNYRSSQISDGYLRCKGTFYA